MMDDTLKTAMDRALNNLDYGDEFTAADLRAILDSHAALRARIEELKAKLEKAVEELKTMQQVQRSDASYGILMVLISYTLAELEGRTDG